MGKLDFTYPVERSTNWYSHFQNLLEYLQQNLSMNIQLFIITLFIIVSIWNQCAYPSIEVFSKKEAGGRWGKISTQ